MKDRPSAVIFRDRSVPRDEGTEEREKEGEHRERRRKEIERERGRERKGENAPCGKSEVERSDEKRGERRDRSGTGESRGTSERTGIAGAAIARSVSLASVSAWLRPTFLHLAGERPLRFFVPRLSVSFRRGASPFSTRRVASRDV